MPSKCEQGNTAQIQYQLQRGSTGRRPTNKELQMWGSKANKKTVKPKSGAADTLITAETKISGDISFEQDPIQILNALLPLYINGQTLRMLQESVASELGARMQAMQSASDNAQDLADRLSIQYNRARQAAITNELCEIVAGANAV